MQFLLFLAIVAMSQTAAAFGLDETVITKKGILFSIY
jgi:hypothetical protein